MKALSLFVLISGLIFSSCGDNTEEQALKEQRVKDSIADAQAKMELAKEEARRQAAEDSTQQMNAVEAAE